MAWQQVYPETGGEDRGAGVMLRMNLNKLEITLLALSLLLLCVLPISGVAAEMEVASKPVVIVGGDRDYPPYEFLDKNGQPAGYNVDLTRAIADVMGMKVEFRFGGWSEMRKRNSTFIPMTSAIALVRSN